MKIREEADPFSMDLGSVQKGGTVKVLEVREVTPHLSGRSFLWRRCTAAVCFTRVLTIYQLMLGWKTCKY